MARRVLVVPFIALVCVMCDSRLADSPQPGGFALLMTTEVGSVTILPGDTLSLNIASIRLWRGVERRDWAVISDTNKVYNLFDWTRGKAVLVSNKQPMYLPPGKYTRLTLRVVLDDTLMTLGGKKFTVRIPSEEYQIVDVDQNIHVIEGETVVWELVFETERSLKLQLGRYLLVPTFRLTQGLPRTE